MLFSATFPPLIQRLSNDILKNNNVMISNKKLVAPNNKIIQTFQPVLKEGKKAALLKILKDEIQLATTKNGLNKIFNISHF